MGEPNPQGLFGVNDVRFYNIATGESLAHLRVLGSVNPEFTAEIEKLMGGSQMFPFDAAIKSFNSSLSITAREYSGKLMEMLLGGTLTEYTADAAGAVETPVELTGTSIMGASQGIASITVKVAKVANLKEGYYLIKATDTNKFDVYAMSSANFARGDNVSYEDSYGKITDTPLILAGSAGVTDLDDFGLTFTCGTHATPALVAADTARFYVRKPQAGGGYAVEFGKSAMEFNEVGCIIAGQTKSGVTTYLHLYRVMAAGMALPFVEKGYAEYTITVEPMYDSVLDAIGVFRRSLL